MKKSVRKAKMNQAPATEEPGNLPIVTDPNGSYTGRPADLIEKQVQDADDL